MGLATLIGVPQGFFIPYRYAAAAEAGVAGYPELEAVFAASEAEFVGWLRRADGFADDLLAIGLDDRPPQPRWGQGWFPRLDAAIAYVMVRSLLPRRLIEVGSGHSTRFCLRAIGDGGLETEVTAIDPAPRADLGSLPLTLIRRPLQQVPLERFDSLSAGDVLSIDSSHILMPGTDLDVFFGRVLPRLPSGVLLHVHDVFLPDPYPAEWAWRGYNEQLAFLPLLLSGEWRPLFSSRYVATRMEQELAESVIGQLPRWPDVYESSLWLQRSDRPAASRGSDLL